MTERDPDAKAKSYYRPVPGSRELLTAGWEDSEELLALERSAPGADGVLPLCPVGGEELGGARVEAEFAAVPLSVFDRLAPLQTPLEQAVYLQFVRLAYGKGRNYCWVGKRELERRCRLSERRLHVALDGLVQKGMVKPMARRNLGTLYRVFLPAEVLDGRPEPGVRLGTRAAPAVRKPRPKREESSAAALAERARNKQATINVETVLQSKESHSPRAQKGAAGRNRPLESPLNEERFADLRQKGAGPAVSVGGMAAAFFKASGVTPTPEEQDAAISEITGLLEDGYQRGEILKAAEWYGKKFPKARKLDRQAYYIHEALEEKK